MDYVFATTQRMLGYIPEHEIWQMTPRHWRNLIKGARHRRLDTLEDGLFTANAMARMTNGANVKPQKRYIEEQRELIDKDKEQVKYEKWVDKHRRKHVRKKQVADMDAWLKTVNKNR